MATDNTDDTRLVFSDYCEENGMRLLAQWLRGEAQLPQWIVNLLNGDKRLPITPGYQYFVSAPNNVDEVVVDFPPMVLTNMHTRRLMNQKLRAEDIWSGQMAAPTRSEYIFEFRGFSGTPVEAELRITTYSNFPLQSGLTESESK